MVGIYKITSPSGKIYIGQAININKRKKVYEQFISHKSSIGPKIYNSLKKYGWENHTHELIEECSLKQLNEKETYHKIQFINEFGWKRALFCELYDNGGGVKSEKTKQKQSKGLKKAYDEGKKKPYWLGKKNLKLTEYNNKNSGFKYKRTEDHKNNLSNMMENIWKDPIKRKQISNKISQNKKGKRLKPIKCDTLFGMTFKSVGEAANILGLCFGNISAVLNGRISHIKGFVFSYL